MKTSAVLSSLSAGAVLALSAVLLPVSAAEVRWVNSVAIPSGASGFFNGKCGLIGCPAAKPVSGSVSVGQTIQGMKVGAIQCEKQTKTMRGFPGGPKYVAIAGTWNCKASVSRAAVNMTPTENGGRPYPWVIVVGAQL